MSELSTEKNAMTNEGGCGCPTNKTEVNPDLTKVVKPDVKTVLTPEQIKADELKEGELRDKEIKETQLKDKKAFTASLPII